MSLRTGALLLVAGLFGALTLGAGSAGAARDPFGGAGDDDQRAVDLLHRSAAAMRSTSYTGTRLLSAWGRDDATTVLVDVEHVAGQGTRLSMRGGGVTEDTATFLAAGAGRGHANGMSPASFDLLTASYAITLGGDDSVAGRRSTVVEVSRAGALAARLWIDDRTGLLLRREVYDRYGRLVRESTFINVDVTDAGFMAHLPPATPDPAGHGIGVPSRAALEAVGWDCPRHAGTMRLLGIEALDRTGALHMAYSDGLSRLSLFEQRGRLAPASVRGFDTVTVGGQLVYVREGLPTYAMWEHDGLVFTAVTDGSLDTVADVVAAESSRTAAAGGFWGRVAGGLARIEDWAAPLP